VYILADIIAILISFLGAYQLRFFSFIKDIIPITKGIPELNVYLNALIVIGVVWLFIFGLMGHYRRRSPSSFDRFYEAFRGVSSGSLIIIATTFFFRGESFSRLVMGLAWMLGIVILFILREVVYQFERSMLRRGYGSKTAILVGTENNGVELYKKLLKQPSWGIKPVGYVGDIDLPFEKLGTLTELDDIIAQVAVDIVIFNLPPDRRDFIAELVIKNENLGIEYMTSPDIMGIFTFNSESVQIEGIPVLKWGRTPIEGYARVVKRSFDIIFSALGIIITAPLQLIIAIAIKIESKGPLFFVQGRVGRNGREFKMLKFRSMKHETSQESKTDWTVENDPRRTGTGVFIRKYSIDELPQLFNVFSGQMSLVGPRPEQPGYVEKFKDDIPRYFQRHKVKSGMTGWAQVNGFRGDTSISERTKYDLYYVENWSLVFDIKIILLTIRAIFKSPNAY
jgi:exopolysaccharide biosynthesis polyprenyl glycosylphosphotransferase